MNKSIHHSKHDTTTGDSMRFVRTMLTISCYIKE